MTPEILQWAERVRKKYPFQPGRVLEVGSLDVNGSIRPLFHDAKEYTGTDMQPGPGVDLVLNNSQLIGKFGANSFDTIVCCECLEHDVCFWQTIDQLHAMLKQEGFLLITTPTLGFPYHAFPYDYWRFTEDSFRHVFFRGKILLDLSILESNTLAGIGVK